MKKDRFLIDKVILILFLIGITSLNINAQTGPGGVGSNDGSGSLKLWLRADQDVVYDALKEVSIWGDYSGNSIDLENSTTAPIFSNVQLNNLPVINFNSNSAGLKRSNVTGSDLFDNSTNTFFFVLKGTSGKSWMHWETAASDSVDFSLSGTAAKYAFSSGVLNGVGDITAGYNFISALNNGANQYIYLNGDQDATIASASTIDNTLSADFFLGSNDGTESTGWTGNIAEVLVFNTNINSAQRLIIENYLSSKYDLPFAAAVASDDKYDGDLSANGDFDFDVAGIGQESDGNNTSAASAGVYITENGSLDEGDYVFIGHDNSVNKETTADVGTSGAEQRWSKTWYIDKTNDVNVKISFDFGEGINGSIPKSPVTDYVLLYRGTNSGDFTKVMSATGIESTDRVYFDVPNTNLNDGYYTIGTEDQINSPLSGAKVWYSYLSGNWDSWTSWTLDPDGSFLINDAHLIPGAADTVIILNGISDTITTNNKLVSSLEVRSGGFLTIVGTTSGHNFTEIKGAGKIKIEEDNFPAGDYSDFAQNGILEFYGTGFTYSGGVTYNQLIVNMDGPGDQVTVTGDITLYSDFTINQGILEISGTTPLNFIVGGDLYIDENGTMKVSSDDVAGTNDWTTLGTGSMQYYYAYHVVEVDGDFTNLGTISFTNEPNPLYNALSQQGAVTLMMKGNSNNSMTLRGTTDLYNFVIDKGSGQNAVLTLYSSDYNNFNLFGANSAANGATSGSYSVQNPELRKALWIKNGTLELTGNVNIASLTEDNGYVIPENARLLLNGADVTVNSTADVGSGTGINVTGAAYDQSTYLYGTLQVTKGSYNTNTSEGIVIGANAESAFLKIEGGNITASQFTCSSSATDHYAYYQSGGTFKLMGDLTGNNIKTTDASFSVLGSTNGYEMTDTAKIQIYDGTATGKVFRVESNSSNYNVTGGTIKIINDNTNSGDNYLLSSSVPIYNLETKILNGTTPFTLDLGSDVTILNNLTINDYTTLDVTATNYNVNIGGDLTIGNTTTTNNAIYNARSNITTFDGSGSSTILVANTSVVNVLTLNNLVIDKDNSSDEVTLSSPGRTATDTLLKINSGFTINKGAFDYGSQYVTTKGDLYNYDHMGKSGSTGRIVLAGTSTQNLYGNLTGTSVFGHIELNNTDGSGTGGTLNTDATFEDFTLSQGIFDIGDYQMTVNSGIINDATAGGFDTSNMIKIGGNPSSKGLRYYFSLTGDYTSTLLATYPIGIDYTNHTYSGDPANGTYYAPITITVNEDYGTSTYTGYIAAATVGQRHPTTDPTNHPEDVAPYYWKTKASGTITSLSSGKVQYDHYFIGHTVGNQYWCYYLLNGNWINSGNKNSNPATYSGLDFITADYSCAKNKNFKDPRVLYSYKDGFFNDPTTWATGSHTGTQLGAAADPPQSYDNVIIGGTSTDNHYVTVNTGNSINVAMIVISAPLSTTDTDESPTLDIASTTGHSFYSLSGGGKFKTSLPSNIPSADLVDFLNNDTAIFEYSGSSYTLPTYPNIYPNLRIGGDASNTKVLPDADILVQKNLEIYDETNTGVTLTLSTTNDIEILDSLVFKNDSKLEFPGGTANSRTVTVDKSIDFTTDGTSDANEIFVSGGSSGSNHKLKVYGDIVLGASKLTLWTANTAKAVDLYMMGSENSTITVPTGGTNNLTLNDLYINKDLVSDTVEILSNLTFTNNTTKPLNISTGSLIFDNSGIDVTLSSGDGDVTIPSTGRLILRNGAKNRITGASSGLILAGQLKLENTSEFILDDGLGTANDNYIEYTSSGNSEIMVKDAAVLTVGSQVRRNTSSTAGILKYYQSGGSVTIAKNLAPNGNRGVFEILNAGSEFIHKAGSLTIVRGQTSPTIASFYLDPEIDTVAAGNVITFGNANTPSSNEIGIYSSVSLHNIEIDNASGNNPTLKIWKDQLSVSDMTINAGTSLDADGYDLIITGNLVDHGTYSPGTNTTLFEGDTQTISGSTTFNNLSILPTTSVTLQASTDITINGNLSLTSGEFADGGNTINLKGDVNATNVAIHSTLAPGTSGGIIFNGTTRQNINGSGTYGRLEINNAKGVNLNNDFSLINDEFVFTLGSLFIQNHSFNIGTSGKLLGNFNEQTMIVTNGVTSDNGVIKHFPVGASNNILIPVGTPNKYTPVLIDITNNLQIGQVTVIPVDQAHPTVTDENNVLQYYWDILSSGFQDLDMTLKFTYEEEDVAVTGTNLESDYLPAYLEDAAWAKFNSDNVNSISNVITFSFSGVSNFSGNYTAGIDAAIPDNVPVFETVADGNWNNPAIWKKDGVPATEEPNGYIVHINHNVTIDENLKSAYKTVINTGGRLYIGTTFGHYLGRVSGTGALALDFGKLPAGNYDDFFSCSGGIIEYGGNTNYIISDEGDTYRKMVLSGTGKRTLPDKDLTFCDTLLINGPTLDNQYNNDIYINGQIELQSGAFDSGIGSSATVIFNGTSQQEIKGNFTVSSAFNNFTINNSAGLNLNGNIEIDGALTLTDGIIKTNANTMLLAGGAFGSVSPAGGQSSSFIDGALSVEIDNGASFAFPIGDGTRYGKLELNTINSSGPQTWVAQYFEDDPDNASYTTANHDLGGSGSVSQTEYWELNGTGSGTVKARWDNLSDVSGLSTSEADIRLMEWNIPTANQWNTIGTTYTGSGANGTIASDAAISFSGSAIPFTLGSVSSLLPTASITSLDASICLGDSYDLIVALTGTANWDLDYDEDYNGGGPVTTSLTGISNTPDTISITPGAAGTYVYTLSDVKDNNGTSPSGVVYGTATVTVYANPTASDAGTPYTICEGDNVTLGASGSGGLAPYTYSWDNAATLSDPSIYNPIAFPVVNTTYTVTVTDANTCQGTTPVVVNVNAAPEALDQTPAALCSEVSGANAQVTVNLTALQGNINTDGSGNTFAWYEDAALSSPVGTPGAAVISKTFGGATSTTEDFYCVVGNSVTGCSDVAKVTYTINRVPETGPQYHISNDWGN